MHRLLGSLALASTLVLFSACGSKTSDDPASPDAATCKEGDERKEDCNTCTCNARGEWMCTLIGCIDSGSVDSGCRPGETKRLDCNTCSCMSNGEWACTGIACVDAGGNDPRCPSTWAAAQTGSHDDLCAASVSCNYAEGSCTCPAYCGGPAPGPDWKPTWTCTPKPPPRTDGCPDVEPTASASCALTSGKVCSYGSCCLNQYECVSGRWKMDGPICPP